MNMKGSIDIPVVYVAGMIDDMKQFESIINLNDLFKKKQLQKWLYDFRWIRENVGRRSAFFWQD